MASSSTGPGQRVPRDWSALLVAFIFADGIVALGFIQQEPAFGWNSPATVLTLLLLGLSVTLTGCLLFWHPSSLQWLARRTSWPKAHGAGLISFGIVLAIQETNLLFRLVPEPPIFLMAPLWCMLGIWVIVLVGQRLGIWLPEESNRD